MKKIILALLIANIVSAQTKLIAYKSHSGNSADFENAVATDFADTNDSNLGLPHGWQNKDKHIDSVIQIDGQKTVVVSTETGYKNGAICTRDTLLKRKDLMSKNIDSIKKALKYDYSLSRGLDHAKFFEKTKTGKLRPLKPAQTPKKIPKLPAKKHPELALLLIVPLCAGLYSWRKKQ